MVSYDSAAVSVTVIAALNQVKWVYTIKFSQTEMCLAGRQERRENKSNIDLKSPELHQRNKLE
jgi:hypothetical protein